MDLGTVGTGASIGMGVGGPIGAVVGAGVGVVASVIGELIAGGQREAAEELRRQAVQAYGNVPALAPTAFENVKLDPQLHDAQMHALSKLQDIEKGGGYTLEDRATLEKQLNDSSSREAGSRGAIEQNMAARGIGGSGAELAAAQSNQQASANRGAELGLNTAAAAQRRYYESIMARGQMASGMESADYGRQAQLAQARDAIARYNNGLAQNKAMVQGGMYNQLATDRREDADRTNRIAGGIGAAGGQAANAVGSYYQKQDDDERFRRLLEAANSSPAGDYAGGYGGYS